MFEAECFRFCFSRRSHQEGGGWIFNNVLKCNVLERNEDKKGLADKNEKTEEGSLHWLSCKKQ